MQRRVYITHLRPEYRAAYLAAHQNIAAELLERYRIAGMKSCGVYLRNDVLVLVTEAEDLDKAQLTLAEDPVDQEWQRYLKPMKADGDYEKMGEIFRADW
ncbi:MAG TPA: L-rhamnose mutarotase [Bryobacteraceae bacterium]|nr:L-rhamnose mutarotase [Bryobacteraceae bacterium]